MDVLDILIIGAAAFLFYVLFQTEDGPGGGLRFRMPAAFGA